MKMQIVGIEVNEGVSKKTGRAYSMGTLHTTTALAPPFGEGNVSKGSMGDRFECDAALLRKVEHLSFPLVAEVEIESVMRFGKREQIVTDIRPVEIVKKAA